MSETTVPLTKSTMTSSSLSCRSSSSWPVGKGVGGQEGAGGGVDSAQSSIWWTLEQSWKGEASEEENSGSNGVKESFQAPIVCQTLVWYAGQASYPGSCDSVLRIGKLRFRAAK